MAVFDLDTFTDTIGTNLTAHTPDVGGSIVKVTPYTDDIKILSGNNASTINGGGNGAFYSYQGTPAASSYSVQCAFTRLTVGVGYPGVLARIQANGNTFYWGFWDDTTGQWTIYKVKAGANTSLATASGSWANGAQHTIKLAVTASSQQLYADGVLVCSASDADPALAAAGTAGIELYNVVNGTACFEANSGFTAQDTATTTINADDANLVYVGKWFHNGSGGSARAAALTSGAYLDAIIGGTATCQLQFDMTSCTSGEYPDVVYSIDGEWYRQTLTSTGLITCTFPTWSGNETSNWATHRLTVMMEAVDDGSLSSITAWSTLQGIAYVQSVIVDFNGATLPIAYIKQQIEFTGDSITETADMLYLSGTNYQTIFKAAHFGWPKQSSDLLGFGCVEAGYSGVGLVKCSNGTGNTAAGVPLLRTAWPLCLNGHTYTRLVSPTMVVVNVGTNDHGQSVPIAGAIGTGFQNTYEAFLQDIRAALPNAVISCICMPSMVGSGINYNTAIPAAITATGDANTYFHDYSSGVFVGGDFADGVHLNVSGACKMAARLSLDLAADLVASGVAMQKSGGSGGSVGFSGGFSGGFNG